LIGWREIRTVLDTGTQINGKLSFTAPTRIEGRLRGEVRAADLLEVAACGVVHGSIWAKSLVVAGEVRGQVLGADRVEIQAGGRVFGLIETRALVVVEGAVFEGDLRMNRRRERRRARSARARLSRPHAGRARKPSYFVVRVEVSSSIRAALPESSRK
jgi:cytoskeletal protein CcmA (bactofilin family)